MIKTITSEDPQDFDDQVNMWESSHNVFATQTHVKMRPGLTAPLYVAVIFYRGKNDYNKS